MAKIKQTRKFYFSVEGETEKWYLEWLRDQINRDDDSQYKVAFDIKVQKDPLKYAKSLVITGKTTVYHLCDYESDEPIHVARFHEAMDQMKSAMNIGKQITYRFGYSNLTFDLWIILHQLDCNGSTYHRRSYLHTINTAFGERFESMDEYKHEDNFKRCLRQLNLSHAIDAVRRSRGIMERNRTNGFTLHHYKGFSYYKENPSLAIHEAVEMILSDCGLID